MRSARRIGAPAALAVLMLAGCTGGGPDKPPAADGTPPARQTARLGIAAPPSVTPHRPDRLIGLSGPAVRGLLGDPALTRRDGEAELWQYRARDCIIDLFFYPDTDDRRKVDHFDIRGRGAGTVARDLCLGTVIAGRSG